MRKADRKLEDTLHESDRNMYTDKAEFYRNSGMDRRRQTEDIG